MTAKRPVRLALAAAAILASVLAASPGFVGASRPLGAPLLAVQRLPVLPAGAVALGAMPAGGRLSMRVVLSPQDPRALSRFIAGVSTPSSPTFRHYLARGQFAARFGPTGHAVDAVRAQLAASGLAVTSLSESHLVLSVSGTAGAFSTALHATVLRWRLATGELGYRLDAAPQLPASIARFVTGVVGVSSLVRQHDFAIRRDHGRRTVAVGEQGGRGTRSVRPQLSPSAPCAQASPLPSGTFSPIQEGQAYGLSTAWSHGDDGTGRTVAVEEFAPYSSSDVVTYDHCFMLIPKGAKSDPHVHNVLVDGGTSFGSAASSDEPTLDVEELRALAPGANVQVYLGPNNVTGPLDVLQRIATDDTAQAVSISWGICEAFSDHADETPIFQQMAAQGQTVFAASGDSGSSDCIGQSPQSGAQLVAAAVDDPASQPLVTGVGGLTVDKLSPLRQSVWNNCGGQPDNCFGNASGGGISSAYPRPAWQVAPGTPTGTARGAHARLVPDVSVIGDPATGMLIYFEGQYQGIGGTSMGAPLMAALDVVAAQSCGTSTLGLVNPLLYSMARHGGAFNDVTNGNNAIATQTAVAREFDAGLGYDMASGLGSPKPTTFLSDLCNGPATATASPPTPGAAGALWEMTFHTGAAAYRPGATVTVVSPPGTVFSADPSYWSVDSTAGSSPPSAVRLSKSPTSTTKNVAVLTPHSEPPAVDLVTIGVVVVKNPKAVGTGAVVISDSVDHLVSTAPLSLEAAVPSATTSTVSVPQHRGSVGSVGVTVSAHVRDGAGNAVLGARITAKATRHGRAILLRTTTDATGTATFTLRDDRVETSAVSVGANGVPVGTGEVAFTDPWRSQVLRAARGLGRILGAPAAVATGRGDGWVALVRTKGGRLAAVLPHGSRLDGALLASVVPHAATTPSLVRVGAWLYAAYRSTRGHLVVVRQGGGDHLVGWRAEDLTAARRATAAIDDPRLVVAGHGARGELSIAWVSRSRLVERTTASLRAPTRFATVAITGARAATGDVAEVANGASDGFVFTTTYGRVLMAVRVPPTRSAKASWSIEDLASSALLDVSGGNAIVGSPTAVVSRLGFTIAALTKSRRVVEFVGTFDNWSAETIVSGVAGASPPAGHATLPALVGTPLVVARGAVTDVVLASATGRLVELSSLSIADPWSSYDLTSLARVVRGGSTGSALLPGRTLTLLSVVGGRLVVVGGGTV